LLAAAAQVGDGFWNVDLAEQFASGRIGTPHVGAEISSAQR
jgi:hypothetical protein